MKTRNSLRREYDQIEKDFFEIQESDGTARVCLHFESPEEIFDSNCLSKTPLFNDDFDEWLRYAFEMIPGKNRIRMEITFDDMKGYTPSQLSEIFKKNLLLSAKTLSHTIQSRDRLGRILTAAGLASFFTMTLLENLWGTESLLHDVFFYFRDIATTVLFWEAAGIFLVENREHRALRKNYRERFASISFH